MMGPTIAFGIPVCLGIMEPEDKRFPCSRNDVRYRLYPVCMYRRRSDRRFDPGMVVINMVPVLIFAVLIALGHEIYPGRHDQRV